MEMQLYMGIILLNRPHALLITSHVLRFALGLMISNLMHKGRSINEFSWSNKLGIHVL